TPAANKGSTPPRSSAADPLHARRAAGAVAIHLAGDGRLGRGLAVPLHARLPLGAIARGRARRPARPGDALLPARAVAARLAGARILRRAPSSSTAARGPADHDHVVVAIVAARDLDIVVAIRALDMRPFIPVAVVVPVAHLVGLDVATDHRRGEERHRETE